MIAILTRIASSDNRHNCLWENFEDDGRPGRSVRPETPNQGADVISLLGKRIRPGNLHQRQREYDESLDDVTSSFLPPRGRVGSQTTDLDSQVPHDGQQACGVETDTKVVQVAVDVTQAVTGPPRFHVVVAPDESVDDVSEILQLHVEDEDDGGEFSVAVEELEGDEADEVGEDAEEDATDEVDCEGGSVVDGWGWTKHEDGEIRGDGVEGDGGTHDGGL